MHAVAPVTVSAASLTAEEVATCFRRGIPFTDLMILLHPHGAKCGKATMNVADALRRGAFIVWLLDLDCGAITIYPSWSHLQVARADDELTMPELPFFRCLVKDFFAMLGIPLMSPAS